ncbi:M23 family metallopeptidase [Cryobacterium psychrotolerans]|nr:M23 family metallopeptidase [Cryobacterium psychrotolerans]TFD90309.1 M23 family metallopeptidase [Cryobacterium psychrotolerans]
MQPLTRRELREQRERDLLASAPLAPAAPVAAALEPAPMPAPAPLALADAHDDAPPAPPAPLTAVADFLISAELSEPDLVPAVLTESDRAVAAPPVGDLVSAFELLVAEVPTTTSTAIPLPSRAQLRAQEQEARSARSRRKEFSGRRAAAPAVPLAPPAEPAPAPASFSPTVRAATPPVRPAGDRARTMAAKSLTVAAMAFVALMAVSTSLPAEALLSSADVQAAAFDAQRSTNGEPAQMLARASGTDTITVNRDGYKAQTIAEVAAASGIRMEATFTNNPNGTIQWPFAVGVHIGSKFGFRDCAGCSSNHRGQDFNPGIGAPIQSIADGVVSQAIDGEGSLGVHMVIDHMIDGELVSSVYAHMIHGSMLFKVGDVVKVGQVVGKTGDTGMSTGPHLHFEIRRGGLNGTHVDPLEWLYANTN